MESIVLLAVKVSIFLTVLTIGMGTSAADLRYVLSRPSRLIKALFVLNILGPVVAVLVCRQFSLHPAVIVGLMTLAVAPVGGMFPKAMAGVIRRGRAAYAHGLFFASTVLAIVITPIAVHVINRIFGGDTQVSPWAVFNVLAGTVLLPLGIGLAIGSRWPSFRVWIPAIQKFSGLVLIVCIVALVAAALPLMESVFREGTLAAIVIIALIDLAAGHLFGGPLEDDRTVLARAAVSRHPGVAIAVAKLTDQPLAPVGVLLAVIVSAIAAVPYTQWRKRRLAGGTTTPHAEESSDKRAA